MVLERERGERCSGRERDWYCEKHRQRVRELECIGESDILRTKDIELNIYIYIYIYIERERERERVKEKEKEKERERECVCVREKEKKEKERERERERERAREGERECVCQREREWEIESQRERKREGERWERGFTSMSLILIVLVHGEDGGGHKEGVTELLHEGVEGPVGLLHLGRPDQRWRRD
jgi:hypothetical protein